MSGVRVDPSAVVVNSPPSGSFVPATHCWTAGKNPPPNSIRSVPLGMVIDGNWAASPRANSETPKRAGRRRRSIRGKLARAATPAIFMANGSGGETADVGVLNTLGGNPVRVRVPPRASAAKVSSARE